jgi:hypothetical protein
VKVAGPEEIEKVDIHVLHLELTERISTGVQPIEAIRPLETRVELDDAPNSRAEVFFHIGRNEGTECAADIMARGWLRRDEYDLHSIVGAVRLR